jgi:hypothetical protein
MKRLLKLLPFFILALLAVPVPGQAALVVDETDAEFVRLVNAELEAMRSGQRGVVSKQLVGRLDAAAVTTTIKMLGPDESTWHPNDHRGTRSHVVAGDTKLRGAARTQPTSATVFLHKPRVDPSMSLYRLGTFVHELSLAADLNEGRFKGDYPGREKRATFYRNGWLDAMRYKLVLVSDRIPTPEYSRAKELGLLTEDNAAAFPILDFETSSVPVQETTAAP